MGVCLIRGDIGGAWAANQFVFVLLVGLALASVAWLVELAGGPVLVLPRRLADQRVWYLVIGVAGGLFALARNLL